MEANEAAEAAERAEDETRAKEEEERKESERLEQERVAREMVEQERQEQIAEARKLLELMEQERREEEEAREEMEAAAMADRARRAAEQLDRERLNREQQEQEQLHHDQTEHDGLETEARAAPDTDEHAQRAADQDEAARSAAEEPRWRHTSHQEEAPQVPQASARARQPLAESPARGSSPSSAVPGMHDRSPTSATFDPPFRSYRSAAPHAPKLRRQEAGPNHVPKPYAVSQLIEDNRPPAPSPPMSRVRPRHVPTFDSDDDSDSVLVQSRIASRRPFSGEAHEVSRAHMGPHQPRSGFASRVPVEPAYPAPPPNYHPSYYAPPSQPPHYPNHGYGMSQQGYPAPNPNPYGPSSHSSSSPYQEPWSQYPPGYPPYGSPPRRQDSSGSRDYPFTCSRRSTRNRRRVRRRIFTHRRDHPRPARATCTLQRDPQSA
ncbi:hypothetical protein A1F94_007451 [Pyrenophora tritici-repentis]|nr:hypothetical protein A1F94_007451 [Pyrenophora tritici-repentis]